MAQKFNWGAALTTLGQGLGDIAERQRREAAMRMLREQQIADRDAQWARQDALAEQEQGQILPGSLYLPGGEASMGDFSGMRLRPAVATLRDMYPPTKPVPPPKADLPDYFMRAPDGSYTGFSGQPWSAAGEGRRVNVTGTHQGRPVVGLEDWTPPQRDSSGGGGRLPDPADVTKEWYGGWVEKGAYDKKTGVASPYRYSYSGKAYDPTASPLDISADLAMAVEREQAAGNLIDTPQEAEALRDRVLAGYNTDLARQMDIQFDLADNGFVQDTKDGKNIPGQYRRKNVPSVAGVTFGPLDRMWGDDVKNALEFYAEVVNKQMADNDTQDPAAVQVEMKTINAWLKKKGLTLDQLSQYINTSRAQGIDLPAAGAAVVNQRNNPAAASADDGTVEMGGKRYRKVGNDWVEVQ